MSINSLIVIPARFKSTRLPGKPLRMIGDDTMLHRVYKRCSEDLFKGDDNETK